MQPSLLAIHSLQQAEADLDIFEPAVSGFSLWPVVRYRAWQLLSRVEPEVMTGSVWRRVLLKPREITRPIYVAWSLFQRRRLQLRRRSFDFVFLSSESYRTVKRRDGWWDVYLDDIANHPSLANRVLRCEFRKLAISPIRTPAPRHLFTDAELVALVLPGDREADQRAIVQGRTLGQLFCRKMEEAGQPLNPDRGDEFVRYCMRHAKMFRRSMAWYCRLFDDVSPRVFVLMNAYNRHGAVAAAIRGNIPVVEFQHGVIHRDHPGYIWSNHTRKVRRWLALPDCIATYGDFWSTVLTSNGFWQSDDIQSVGSARMDWLRNRPGGKPRSSEGLNIVFTTQHPTRAHAIALLREFIEHAQAKGMTFQLTIKVHSMEAPFIAEYEQLASGFPNVSIMSAYQGDTLALIAAADVHVSGWSTCHYESIGLGTPTIVLRFPGPDRTADMKGLSGVWTASDAQQLLERIVDLRVSQSEDTGANDSADGLFKRNAVENAVSLLLRLMPRA